MDIKHSHEHKYTMEEIEKKLDEITKTEPTLCILESLAHIFDGNPTRDDLNLAAVTIYMIGAQVGGGARVAARIAQNLSNEGPSLNGAFVHPGNKTVN